MLLRDLRVGLIYLLCGTRYASVICLGQDGSARLIHRSDLSEIIPKMHQLLEALDRSAKGNRDRHVLEEFSENWGPSLFGDQSIFDHFEVLIIIPSHYFHALPFQVLWNSKRNTYLGMSHGISYCTSGTLLQRCCHRNRARLWRQTWAMALDSDDKPNAPPPPQYCLSLGSDILTEKRTEYEGLARLFASHFRHSQMVTVGNTRHMLKRSFATDVAEDGSEKVHEWEVVCAVCHGHWNRFAANDSGLLLEDIRIGRLSRSIRMPQELNYEGYHYIFPDEPLAIFPAEIETQAQFRPELLSIRELAIDCTSNADLVALFGCSTGAGEVLPGNDFASFALHWLKAGAASALASRWELDIRIAAEFVPSFLNNWIQNRQPKAIALREALRSLLAANTSLSLADWAPLTLYGDWV